MLACCWGSCGDVKGDPVDSDADDVAGPDGEDVTVDTVVPDVPDDPVVPDVPDDPVVPDGDDVDEEFETWCEEDGGYCTSFTDPDGCVTCEDVGGTHYLPARGAEGAMECTASGDDSPYCCLPEMATSPPECVTGGGGCYRRPGSGGNVCPPGWVVDTSMACGGGAMDCCVPGPDCS
jgi:hypothetical protein